MGLNKKLYFSAATPITLFRDRCYMEKSALKPCTEIDVHCGGIVLLLRFFIFVESIYNSVIVLHNA